MEKEGNNSAVVYVLELPDCLNLHYFVYFVTDYIDGIDIGIGIGILLISAKSWKSYVIKTTENCLTACA